MSRERNSIIGYDTFRKRAFIGSGDERMIWQCRPGKARAKTSLQTDFSENQVIMRLDWSRT